MNFGDYCYSVSLKWLFNSKHALARNFRNAVDEQLYNLMLEKERSCYICSCFLDNELHKLDIEWLSHFQQIANSYGIPIKIISIEHSKREILKPKIKVELI